MNGMNARADSRNQLASLIRSMPLIVIMAFAVRIFSLFDGAHHILSPKLDHFDFGWEAGRIARSLALGKGYSSPFQGETGPTAWLAPLYPLLLAGIFKVFGIYTAASAFVSLTLNCIFSALTCIPIRRIGESLFRPAVGVLAAWIWVFLPNAVLFPVNIIWDSFLAALLMSLILLMAVRLQNSGGLWLWVLFGLLGGMTALNSPSCLSLFPFVFAWPAWRLYRQGRGWAVPLGVAGLVCALTVSPWLIWNYQRFGQFIPFRSNFGVELYIGNNEHEAAAKSSEGFLRHPSQNALELSEYSHLGEIVYVAGKRREALDFIKAHPFSYLRLSCRRILRWWTGIGGRRVLGSLAPGLVSTKSVIYSSLAGLSLIGLLLMFQERRDGLLMIASYLLVYPIPYYLSQAIQFPRYRHPIEPEMVLLAAVALIWIQSRWLSRRPAAEAGAGRI